MATQFRRNHLRRLAYQLEKKTAKVGRVLFEQIGPEGVVGLQTGTSVGSQVHPRSLRMVPSDRRQNFLHFLFPVVPCSYLASFLSYGEKNEISEKESWLPWQRPLKIRKLPCSDRSSTATAEPNGENRVKIRPMEVVEVKMADRNR